MQGDPFVHDDNFPQSLEIEPDGFTPLGHWRVECDQVGAPHHPWALPIVDSCERWFGFTPPERIPFTAGAQFVVPGSLILKHPRVFYRGMVGRMSEEHAPWVMERLWELFFNRS